MATCDFMQCPNCVYARDVLYEAHGGHGPGHMRSHCCRRCRDTGGKYHDNWCKRHTVELKKGVIYRNVKHHESVVPPCVASSPRSRSPRVVPPWVASAPRSRSPRKRQPICRRATSPESRTATRRLRIVDQSNEAFTTWIVTLGLVNNTGPAILAENLVLSEYLIDVRDWLERDVQSVRTPRGTFMETQEELKRYEGFPDCFEKVVGHVMSYELTVLGCTSGHHRSVAMGEIVAKHIRSMGVKNIKLIHIDHNASRNEKDWLCNWRPARWYAPEALEAPEAPAQAQCSAFLVAGHPHYQRQRLTSKDEHKSCDAILRGSIYSITSWDASLQLSFAKGINMKERRRTCADRVRRGHLIK